MVVRPDPGLVSKVDGRALLLGRGPDGGVLLTLPPLHGRGILLVGAVQRPLRRKPELAQQPACRNHRQSHAEFAADHLADHLPGPQRELELHLARIGAHNQRIQPG